MNENELRQVIEEGEGYKIEFKESLANLDKELVGIEIWEEEKPSVTFDKIFHHEGVREGVDEGVKPDLKKIMNTCLYMKILGKLIWNKSSVYPQLQQSDITFTLLLANGYVINKRS